MSRRRKQAPTSAGDGFGRYLRDGRQAAGFSLAAMAAKLGVTKGYVSRLEQGKSSPSETMIARIAGILEADPAPLSVLAGRVPLDVQHILSDYPVEAPALLRETFASPYADSAESAIATTEVTTPPTLTGVYHRLRPTVSAPCFETILGDCFEWLERRPENSIHAVVTDPPYGLKEYTEVEKSKLRAGRGGVWRIPPTFDGCKRNPLPRFTVLTEQDQAALRDSFARWAKLVVRVLVPGGHVFIATNPLVSHLVYGPMIEAGFEKRGEIIRLVQTLRGGDRPKNAHREFADVTVMPRSAWEPWGLFRKPCEGRVQDNLRKWQTGGLRRVSGEQPFADVIRSAPTRNGERGIAPHPSLKPQAFMRQIVRAALPLGKGVILDPFMGAGSTIAAACAVGYQSIGIESDPEFYRMAVAAIPKLTALMVNGESGNAPLRTARGSQTSLFV